MAADPNGGHMVLQRTVHWQGVDDPHRLDEAVVKLDRDRLSATGTSATPDYRLQWSLRTGTGWVTRSLEVQIAAPTWSRRLAVVRDAAGQWTSEGRADSTPVTARGAVLTIDGSDWDPERGDLPGIVDPPSLIGADDCDLGLCPLTNTMPMLRSILPGPAPGRSAGGGSTPGPEVPFVMAWVEVPSLRVIRSEQFYQLRRVDVDGTSVVRYIGLHRSFEGDLSVDRDGLVIDYPQLARRVDPPRAD
jgi:hypothetical protein